LLLQVGTAIMKQFFVYGNLMDATNVFDNVIKRPAARYLAECLLTSTSSASVTDAIVTNIKNFLGKTMKTKGTRKTLEQQTYRTVMAACSGDNIVASKLLHKASKALGVHIRNIVRGVTDRTALQEQNGSGFVKCTRKEYRNKMPEVYEIFLP